MATSKDFVEKTLEKLLPLDVVAKPMFGEYGLYHQGKMFGLLCDNALFVKVTDAGSELASRTPKAPPYPNAKAAFKISPAKMNDREWLTKLVEVTTDESPFPKKRSSKRREGT